ncbi:hypothetical protein FKM82_003280 [Ascaphus truei]
MYLFLGAAAGAIQYTRPYSEVHRIKEVILNKEHRLHCILGNVGIHTNINIYKHCNTDQSECLIYKRCNATWPAEQTQTHLAVRNVTMLWASLAMLSTKELATFASL